ncbi:hypothetical protein P43SY_001149 [Pythium insidiosum]|uniref:Peptidase S1 domain-containing protein n=1 Tax=Pythium insidiosum TaxID=114742 RepID=A0AAD5LC62_PYTIN|nr:hypothetical protein P43SY_001149 [Pythium insidiosum]
MAPQWIWLLAVALVTCCWGIATVVAVDTDEVDAARDLSDRVAVLLTDGRDPNRWCMGLLVAPDSLVTYAHCVRQDKAALVWAFFGDTKDQFLSPGRAISGSGATNGNGSASASASAPQSLGEEEVGWMNPWARIKSITVHPDFQSVRTTPSADLAVVRIDLPRVTPPFPLASKGGVDPADWNTTRSGFFRPLQGYQVSNLFLLTGRMGKIREKGDLRRVGWRYCERRRQFPVDSDARGQVCVVASQVLDRRYEVLNDTFVMLGDKLIGLSVDTAPTDSHRVLFLSEHTDFIHSTAKKQTRWIPVTPMNIGGQAAPFQGYLVGLRANKTAENFCLGSLIAPDMVLTAAHCVYDVKFDRVSVGSVYASTDKDGEQIKVKRVVLARDTLANVLLQQTGTLDGFRYTCSDSIQLYTRGSTDAISALITRFDTHPLRLRHSRFERASPGEQRLPSCRLS